MSDKKPSPRPSAVQERPTSRQRREQRDMKRRERLMVKQSRKGGLRERIIGCGFSALIVGGVVFVVGLIVALIYFYAFDR